MADEISEVIGKDSKVAFTHVIECKKIVNNENATAVIIVFDNGHTEVRCPVKQDECACAYGDRSRPIHQKERSFWQKTKDTLLRVLIIVCVIYFLVLEGIRMFMPPT